MLYTPDQFKAIQEGESKDREDADDLLRPATQPATKPDAAKPTKTDDFKIDWHDTVKRHQLRHAARRPGLRPNATITAR